MEIGWSVIRIMLEMIGIVGLICFGVWTAWLVYRRKG